MAAAGLSDSTIAISLVPWYRAAPPVRCRCDERVLASKLLPSAPPLSLTTLRRVQSTATAHAERLWQHVLRRRGGGLCLYARSRRGYVHLRSIRRKTLPTTASASVIYDP